jgi:hypothetical protein
MLLTAQIAANITSQLSFPKTWQKVSNHLPMARNSGTLWITGLMTTNSAISILQPTLHSSRPATLAAEFNR